MFTDLTETSSEFSEKKHGKWLFDPENPESSKWIEANSLEKLKVETKGTYNLLDEGEIPPPGSKILPIFVIYCRKRCGTYKARACIGGHL